ncbi:MAG: HlyD family efflux transporter periplasmic adaptor subunit [Planctomycetaceae bacterium]|nr:HlyD family efflux transporter periplasmic adaptor subunit [Planctomycetaceae bacterium]
MPVDPLKQEPEVELPERRRTMLVPVAYSESVMPALRLARSSRIARSIAKWLFAGMLLSIILMAFAPWQQSVTGSGSVLAYAPGQRPQVIEATIEGRIVRWGDGIVENSRVKKGDFLAEIRDLDERYADRLNQQLAQSEQAVTAAEQQLTASRSALEVAKTIIELYEAQVEAYQSVKRETIAAQNAYVEMAEKKVSAEEQQLLEYKAAVPQLEAEFERTKKLQDEGNLSLQKLQEVERKLIEARAKVNRAEAYVASARSELEGKERDRIAKTDKAQVDIDYAQAEVRKANGNVAKAEGDVAKAEQELNKVRKDLLDMQVKVARQQSQMIEAPFDGIVVQITPNLGTAVLKKGDPVCTIVPETKDRSVQLQLDGNDAPLVEPGRHVRLQFEGWPAVQFAGWPSVAVGTFGGEIVSVDATDNGKGKFRVLIRPDLKDNSWPDERFLRQGVRANGWVLLNRVPLWFEVWRQLNGFPPVVDIDGSSEKGSKSKPPKLPK